MASKTTHRTEFLSEIQIRKATAADHTTLIDFNMRMAKETESLSLDRERLQKGVTAVLQDSSKGVYYVAEYHNQVIGQLLITYEWSDWRNGVFWWIQSVYVVPEFRRRKVFTALYRFIEDQARATPSVCGLRLYFEEQNEKAAATYLALGMKHTHYRLMENDFVIGTKS